MNKTEIVENKYKMNERTKTEKSTRQNALFALVVTAVINNVKQQQINKKLK